jgi:NAD(P) transhydrogenase subunit alpha
MYATNIVNLIKLLLKNDAIAIDTTDEIVRETLVTHEGKVVHPKIAGMMPNANVNEEVTRS